MQRKIPLSAKTVILVSLTGVTGILSSFYFISNKVQPGLKQAYQKESFSEVDRGERLSLMICANCHSDDNGQLSGRLMENDRLGKIYSANITGSESAGIGSWTKFQLKYFLRTGITPDNKKAFFLMPRFPIMAERDLNALVAFIKSDRYAVKPVNKPAVKSRYAILAKFIMLVGVKRLKFPGKTIPLPDTTQPVKTGKYLVTAVLDCYACHSKSLSKIDLEFPEKTPGFLKGGSEFKDADNYKVIAPPIEFGNTGHPAYYNVNQFRLLMKTGQKKNGESVRSPMVPQPMLSDAEIFAIYSYLKTRTPTQKNE